MDGSIGAQAPTEFKTGDNLASQWGYSMQLVTFYRVIRGASVGRFAIIQKIPQKVVASDNWGQAGKVVADFETEATEAPIKRKVLRMHDPRDQEPFLKISQGEYARLWNGQPLNFDTYD